MKTIGLDGKWKMKKTKNNEWIEANVPGTVVDTLLNAKIIDDPYYRDNEELVKKIFNDDYEYQKYFYVETNIFKNNKIQLCCEGIDTISQISINGMVIANTDNMHRTYVFDVKKYLKVGKNTINILIRSPVEYAKKMAVPIISGSGIEYIRKAQCMYGWDWGLFLPDSGIWRNIYIECFNLGKVDDINILQNHNHGKVELEIISKCSIWGDFNLDLKIELIAPDGKKCVVFKKINKTGNDNTSIIVLEPKLWWPIGFGEHSLYEVNIYLEVEKHVLDKRRMKIGLRTVELKRKNDEWGKSYEFIINGKPIFIKGSNLIIEDALIGRPSQHSMENTIKNCVEANFNCIRVWGGAYYPSDIFYDLCDRYGIIVYQDLMFACKFYPSYDEFTQNIEHEINDNIKRIRHHACIGVLCGNNEVEQLYAISTSEKNEMQELRNFLGIKKIHEEHQGKIWGDYISLFCERIPNLLGKLDLKIPYVHSSPSSDKPGVDSISEYFCKGDSHYYLAYDNLAPYSKIRDMKFRFITETGFQSYPNIKTIKSFAAKEDLSPYSKVMLNHQKCPNGNEIIETYMKRDYKTPKDFENYVYTSQILAGEILKYSVEHLRRIYGCCMGIITWQLNDCWPVVSWSGVDYYGRWKAQQYFTKRFYAPILISALDKGKRVELWITNDSSNTVQGIISWKLMDNKSCILKQGSLDVEAKECNSKEVINLDFSDKIDKYNENGIYLQFEFVNNNRLLSCGTLLFVKPKDFNFINPEINTSIEEENDKFLITVKSISFAKSVCLDLLEADCIFSDNYFDISCGDNRVIEVLKSTLSQELDIEEFKHQLKTMSVYDI